MDQINILTKAIRAQTPIEFQYNKIGKALGNRRGDVYAIYNFIDKYGKRSIKVHILQRGGVTDTKADFPEFRTFNIEDFTNINFLEGKKFLPISGKYNKYRSGYKNAIALI